jgi:hypothetical protein
LIKHLPLIVAFDLAAFVLAFLRGRGLAALRARVDVLKSLPHLLRARNKVQSMRKISNSDVERLFTRGEGAFSTFRRKMWDK